MINIFECAKDASVMDNYDKDFKKVAKIHKYWSRKPFHLVESCILKYSNKGDEVLDPFCGSGSTGIGAVLNDRKYIGYDLNPTACIISKLTLDMSFSDKKFDEELEELIRDIKKDIMDLYSCGNNEYILYTQNLPIS